MVEKDLVTLFVGTNKYGDTRSKACCPYCGGAIMMDDFYDDDSHVEFTISGLCQYCQDEAFGGLVEGDDDHHQ